MMRNEILNIIAKNRQVLTNSYGVKHLYLFGSVARDEAQSTSDVDFLVEFSRPTGLFGLLSLQEFLEFQIGRKVDLGTYESLKPYIKKEVDKDMLLVT
jgi:predicted nucleotidyltransferase